MGRRGAGALRSRTPLCTEELIELSIERIGARGDGIAQYRGQPVFVPFTVPGDRVLARLGARRGGGWEGLVVDRRASGPGRTLPQCRHFETCGGCTLQHLDLVSYHQVKIATLYAALERVGIDPGVVVPLRVLPPERRRARLGLARPRDPRSSVRVGYRERFRHDLIDLRECPVLEPALLAVVEGLREIARDLLAPGGTAEAALTHTDSGVDMLIEAAERPGLGACEALAHFAREYDLARIVWHAGVDEIVVVERRRVRIVFSGVVVPFPPGAFLQASRSAETILVEEVVAGVGSRRPVADLFAGLGAFTLALARDGPVHAVDGDARSVAALAAAAAHLPGVTAERRDLARNPLSAEALDVYEAAVFDPPRVGAARQAEALSASRIETVVAISCNPATFARDAATLVRGGFRLERVTPVDQFVWSPHLELAAIFRR